MAGTRAVTIAQLTALPALLLLLGAAGALALLHGNGGYGWPDSALVVVDGEPHQVAVQAGRRTMLWTYEFDAASACTMVDAAGGAVLAVTPARAGYRAAGGGTPGDWTGTETFVPASARVVVTCSGANTVVAVHTAPSTAPRSMGARLGHAGAALALGVMAVLAAALVVGFSLDRRSRPGPEQERPSPPLPPRDPTPQTRLPVHRPRAHRPAAHACNGRRTHARRPSSTRHH